MDCIFCKIINGEIPSKKLYEDDMLTKREATLILSAMEKPVLTLCGKLENELRAQILIAFLNNLRYE